MLVSKGAGSPYVSSHIGEGAVNAAQAQCDVLVRSHPNMLGVGMTTLV